MFRDAERAIEWAALMKYTLILDGSSMNEMSGRSRPSTTNELLMGLSPQEAKQQAENIIGYISELRDPACGQYLMAKFFMSSELDLIMQRVFARLLYSGGIHNRDVRKVVLKYLGANIGKREIRESLHCDMNKVDDFINKVYNILDPVHYQAMDEIEQKLIEVGLIERMYEVAHG